MKGYTFQQVMFVGIVKQWSERPTSWVGRLIDVS